MHSSLSSHISTRLKTFLLQRTPGAPYPRFPVECIGFRALHAPFLKRKAHTQSCPGQRTGNSGYLARFSRDVGYRRPSPQTSCGLHNSTGVPYVRTSVARISYYAARAATTHAAFSQRKPHEVAQRHLSRQEIRDTWAENGGRSPTTAFLFNL